MRNARIFKLRILACTSSSSTTSTTVRRTFRFIVKLDTTYFSVLARALSHTHTQHTREQREPGKRTQTIIVITIINKVFGFNSSVVQLEVIKYAIVVIVDMHDARQAAAVSVAVIAGSYIERQRGTQALVGVRHEQHK